MGMGMKGRRGTYEVLVNAAHCGGRKGLGEMRWWYRLLVGFLAMAAALCTAGMAYACLSLGRAESGWSGSRAGDRFCWSNGFYSISGALEDGALSEMTIRRLPDAAEN